MAPPTQSPFNARNFITLTAAIAGLGLPLTGYMNHLFQMEPLFGPRHAWMAAHTALGIVFSIFTIWHIILNRRAILMYFKGVRRQNASLSKEAIMAMSVVGLGLFIAVGHAFH